MKLCKCGCGQEVGSDSADYLPGHYAKMKSKMIKNSKTISEENPAPEQKKKNNNWLYYLLVVIFLITGIVQYILLSFFRLHWLFLVIMYAIDLIIFVYLIWIVYSFRKKQEMVIFQDIEDFIKQVPKWAINEKSPKSGLIGAILNKGKDYKQLVFVSEHFEPKTVWSEWDGFLFRIGNRAYKPPRDVRGDQFIYHVDKKMPLIDSAEATTEDAEDSYHLLAVWNQAFSVGHAAALNETQTQIKIILILVGCILGAVIILALYSYSQFGDIQTKLVNIDRIVAIIQQQTLQAKP